MTSSPHTKNYQNHQAGIKPTVFERTPSNHHNTEHEYPEVIDFETDNVTNLYNNPAVISSTAPGPRVPKPQTTWGMPRVYLFLCPAFCVEFCRVFATLFTLVHTVMHFAVTGLPLLFGGLLGLFFTIYTSSMYKTRGKLTKETAMAYFLLYQLLLFFGTSLIVGASWSSLSFEDDSSLVNISNSTTFIGNGSSVEFIYKMPKPPLLNRLFTAVGYVILSSTTGSGQYLILCVATSLSQMKPQDKSYTTVIVLLTAVGACTAGLVDVVDTASNWCPALLCPSHVTAQAAIISSSILCLLGVGLACSLVAYYGDVLLIACRQLRVPSCKPVDQPSSWNTGRRSTRTAQEIYDECAPLLQDHETSFSGNSNATDDNDPIRPFYDTGLSSKRYPHQITPGYQEPNLRKMLKTKSYIGVLVGTFLLLIAQTTFQFYGSLYLSQVAPVTNRTGFKIKLQNLTGDFDWTQLEEPVDLSRVFGLKINGLAVILSNGIFIILFLKRKTILESIKPDWQKWIIPSAFLIFSLLAYVTGASSKIAPFLLTACTISVAKVVETMVLHSMVARLARTWPPMESRPTDGPTTVLWCLIPFSLVISSVAIMVIHDLTSLPALSMYLTATFALVAGIPFFLFGIKMESASM